MSNHFTGLSLGPPLGDQRLDLCDLYVFQSPATRQGRPSSSMPTPMPTRSIPAPSTGSTSTLMGICWRTSRSATCFPSPKRQADGKRLCRQGRRGPVGRSDRHEDHRRRRGLLRPQAQHHEGRQLHCLHRQSQRCLLLRLYGIEESIQPVGRTKLHVAPGRRQGSLDRRQFEHRGQRVLDGVRTADERARHQVSDPRLGTMQRQAGRQAAPCRSRRPPIGQQLLQHRRTKLEYNASEPINDRKRWTPMFVHLMGHTGNYTEAEAVAAIDAHGLCQTS